ncbi:hypothetical protein J7L68_06170 [bacterium]|nr:hypothetical protein [bacterium]
MTIKNKKNDSENPDNSENEIPIKEMKLPLIWRSHPAAENRTKGIITLIIIIIAGIFSAIFMQSLIWGFFAVAVLFLGLAKFFFPTDYAVDSTGVREKFIGTEKIVSWRQFKRILVHKNDIFLSPFPKKHILDRFRGFFIRTPDKKTAEFIAGMVKNALR